MDVQLLTVSSKGQISLPIAMRKELSIHDGDKLVIYSNRDTIILKPISLPIAEELENKLDQELRDKYNMTDEEIYVNKFVKKIRRERLKQK